MTANVTGRKSRHRNNFDSKWRYERPQTIMCRREVRALLKSIKQLVEVK